MKQSIDKVLRNEGSNKTGHQAIQESLTLGMLYFAMTEVAPKPYFFRLEAHINEICEFSLPTFCLRRVWNMVERNHINEYTLVHRDVLYRFFYIQSIVFSDLSEVIRGMWFCRETLQKIRRVQLFWCLFNKAFIVISLHSNVNIIVERHYFAPKVNADCRSSNHKERGIKQSTHTIDFDKYFI